MSVAALVLGILGLLGCVTPVFGVMAVVMCLVALCLGIAGARKARHVSSSDESLEIGAPSEASGGNGRFGMGVAGAILGGVGLVVGILAQIFWFGAFSVSYDYVMEHPDEIEITYTINGETYEGTLADLIDQEGDATVVESIDVTNTYYTSEQVGKRLFGTSSEE